MTDHRKEFFGAIDEITAISQMLARTAFAFEEVGNDQISGRLLKAAQGLIDAVDSLTEAHSAQTIQALKRSQDMTGAILAATINGCIIGAEGRKDG